MIQKNQNLISIKINQDWDFLVCRMYVLAVVGKLLKFLDLLIYEWNEYSKIKILIDIIGIMYNVVRKKLFDNFI